MVKGNKIEKKHEKKQKIVFSLSTFAITKETEV